MTPSARARARVTRTTRSAASGWGARLRNALPGGEQPLRTAVWEFLRPSVATDRAAP